MSNAPGLFLDAIARGLVSSREVLCGRVSVTDQSRSNVVRRIELDGRPVAFVKSAGAAATLDGDDPIGSERRVLTALRGVAVVPTLIGEPGPLPGEVTGRRARARALWTGVVDGIPLYAVHGTSAHLLAVAQAWGASVAGLHRAVEAPTLAAQGVAAVAAPWVLRPDRLPASMGEPPSGSSLAALLDEARSAPMRAIAAQVAAGWAPEALLHGDLGAANVIVAEVEGGPLARFVDLEGAGLGPVDWDLACALDTLGGLVRQWGCPEIVPAFVAGYRAGGGRGSIDPGHLAVRALVSGWQSVAGLSVRGDLAGAGAEARVHLDRARHWMAVWERSAARRAGRAVAPFETRERGAA